MTRRQRTLLKEKLHYLSANCLKSVEADLPSGLWEQVQSTNTRIASNKKEQIQRQNLPQGRLKETKGVCETERYPG